MSETQDQTAGTATKAKKAPAEVIQVLMNDGRTVAFAGKRKMLKTSDNDEESATVRFDFVNGESRNVRVSLGDALLMKFVAHGISQKVGDETSGVAEVDDMILNVDNILERLQKGEWGAERGTGDGFSGASIVVRAIMEASGKDQAFVKAFLEKKLAEGSEAGLTRQKLYASFKAPGTKTAAIISRLESERAAKDVAVDADSALAEMMG